MFNVLNGAAKVYGAVSKTVGVVAHPIHSAQDAIRGYLVEKAVGAVIEIAGAVAAQELTARVQAEKRIALELKVHRKARGLLSSGTLSLLENMVNDGLAAPLAAVGLRIGALALEADEAGEILKITGLLKLESSSAPANVRALPIPA